MGKKGSEVVASTSETTKSSRRSTDREKRKSKKVESRVSQANSSAYLARPRAGNGAYQLQVQLLARQLVVDLVGYFSRVLGLRPAWNPVESYRDMRARAPLAAL